MNLNHLHIHVRSVPDAAAFYLRYFGLRELTWHDGVLFMRDSAGMDLALAPGPIDSMPPWFHFGFRLDSAQSVDALHLRMTADRITIREPLTVEDDFSFFRCTDPDGYLLEIYYEPDPA